MKETCFTGKRGWVDKDGNQMDFPQIVAAILVEEQGRTQEDADRLVKQYPQVLMNGILGGIQYRATALALEMKENDAAEAADRRMA